MADIPTPGSWRLESNDFEKEVALAIIRNPLFRCLDIMMLHDVNGNITTERDEPFTRADIVEVHLLDEVLQRRLHRKFFFETVAKVMTSERCEFPDKKTVVLDEDVKSFTEENLIDLARTYLGSDGYNQQYFLWGPKLVSMQRGD